MKRILFILLILAWISPEIRAQYVNADLGRPDVPFSLATRDKLVQNNYVSTRMASLPIQKAMPVIPDKTAYVFLLDNNDIPEYMGMASFQIPKPDVYTLLSPSSWEHVVYSGVYAEDTYYAYVCRVNIVSGAAFPTELATFNFQTNTWRTVCQLNGKGGECNLHGLYLAGGKQEISNRVNIYHNAGECKSNQLFKGILDGEAITRFSGTIYVEKGAQKTEAYQANNNLLASDGATAYTKPHLEIYADDVKCSHGATIGSLNEDELFYMRSRGISLDEAKLLQQQAFANATIEDIANPELRERLTSLVESRLRGEFSDCEKCDRHCC